MPHSQEELYLAYDMMLPAMQTVTALGALTETQYKILNLQSRQHLTLTL